MLIRIYPIQGAKFDKNLLTYHKFNLQVSHLEAFKLENQNELFKVKDTTEYFTTWDGSKLYSVSWIPKGMKVLIILVHGLGEHMFRYKYWATLFNASNVGVIGFDLRGHGHNNGIRGKLNYNDCLKDIDAFIALSHERYPFIPKIIYGQSMGGNLVLRYAIDYKPRIAGIISSSPWLKLVNMPSPQVIDLVSILGKLFPFLTLPNRINSDDLSRDKSVGISYRNDPLVHNKISPDLFLKACEAGLFILQNRHKINLPLLLMHGTGDNITSSKASTDFANFTSENTNLRLWKDAFHELHNEIDKTDIFQYILRWIEQLPAIQQR